MQCFSPVPEPATGADVWFTARSPSKADQAIAELESETGRRPKFLQLDLSDLANVKKSAERFKSCVRGRF
jgi:retinol dehydrogenase 12